VRPRVVAAAIIAVALCSVQLGGAHAAKRRPEAKTKASATARAVAHPPLDPLGAGLGTPVPVFDPAGRALDPWWAALDRAAQGKAIARIAFYGASHTAADLWTGTLRRRLQARYGDAGHGFVLPARWNLGYRHQDIATDATPTWAIARHLRAHGAAVGDYGLAGLRMESQGAADWAEIRTTTAHALGRSVDRIELWYRTGPESGDLMVQLDGAAEVLTGRGAAAVVRKVWTVADGSHALRWTPAGNGTVGVDGAVFERGPHGVVLDQLGIPGMQAEIHLHWSEGPWAEQLGWRSPDLVVLAYGTNDVAEPQDDDSYLAVWQRVLGRIRKAAPQAACLVVGPSDRQHRQGRKWVGFERTATVIALQRKVAAAAGCGHWDAQAAMGGPGAISRWIGTGLATGDRVHLNRDGYARLAELLDHALHGGLYGRAKPQRRE